MKIGEKKNSKRLRSSFLSFSKHLATKTNEKTVWFPVDTIKLQFNTLYDIRNTIRIFVVRPPRNSSLAPALMKLKILLFSRIQKEYTNELLHVVHENFMNIH